MIGPSGELVRITSCKEDDEEAEEEEKEDIVCFSGVAEGHTTER